jgi:hypothetical protein
MNAFIMAVDHGKYDVYINELGKGLSILTPGYLLGYRARELLDLKTIKCAYPSSSNEFKQFTEDKKKIKKELDALKPIIFFDEAHYTNSTYQKEIQRIIEGGYQVLKGVRPSQVNHLPLLPVLKLLLIYVKDGKS